MTKQDMVSKFGSAVLVLGCTATVGATLGYSTVAGIWAAGKRLDVMDRVSEAVETDSSNSVPEPQDDRPRTFKSDSNFTFDEPEPTQYVLVCPSVPFAETKTGEPIQYATWKKEDAKVLEAGAGTAKQYY